MTHLPQKMATNNFDIERLSSSHQQLFESQEGMIKSVESYTTSILHRYPSITIDAPIDCVTNEDFIGLKVKVAELQTELGVERFKSNRKEAIVVSLLEASEHVISDLQGEVSQLKGDSDEMESRLMLLICELERLKECPKTSDIKTDLRISSRLRNQIVKVISALAEERHKENEGLEGAQTKHRLHRRSMPITEDVVVIISKVSLLKKHSSSPDLKVDAAMASPPTPAFRNMLRRFNYSLLSRHLPSDASSTIIMANEQSGTKCHSTSFRFAVPFLSFSPNEEMLISQPKMVNEQSGTKWHSTNFSFAVPFLSCSPNENMLISQPKSQKKSRPHSYVDDDLDGSQAYLTSQNTVVFPGDESNHDTVDMLGSYPRRRTA
eukprot:CAMPEP_0201876566 /NCGR_PEP_ID=MMETSP0902-20130614/8217_1 /ASSEMBLY_ACC=CAM_ASM_000551 /TAXON_ID=420261 /ORGANISM="Thalassiosira antarctica, Strain CCMP982" /LENGTH=377 /DNA_ID=CAMNT_0048403841 /DNA_START=117 /DNA_END=1250 /DNA_ORIENTATION=+